MWQRNQRSIPFCAIFLLGTFLLLLVGCAPHPGFVKETGPTPTLSPTVTPVISASQPTPKVGAAQVTVATPEPTFQPTKGAVTTKPLITPVRSGEKYRVRSGDTLYSIAQAHGITVGQLKLANGIPATSDGIRVGQSLTIPAPGTEQQSKKIAPEISGGEGATTPEKGLLDQLTEGLGVKGTPAERGTVSPTGEGQPKQTPGGGMEVKLWLPALLFLISLLGSGFALSQEKASFSSKLKASILGAIGTTTAIIWLLTSFGLLSWQGIRLDLVTTRFNVLPLIPLVAAILGSGYSISQETTGMKEDLIVGLLAALGIAFAVVWELSSLGWVLWTGPLGHS